MKKIITLLLVAAASFAQATLVINTANSASVITFSSAVSDTWYGVPTSGGYSPTPSAASPYDSDTWAVRMGASASTNLPTANVSTTTSVGWGSTQSIGGINRAFNATAGFTSGFGLASNTTSGYMMALKPSGTGTDNLSIWMRVQNNTGSSISSWIIDFDAYAIDITANKTPFNFAFATVADGAYTSVAALSGTTAGGATVTTPTVADWTSIAVNATTINATVANGDYLYLRWMLGSDIAVNLQEGNRLGIDNISITANSVVPEPATVGMLGFGALIMLIIRRMR